MSIKNKIFSDAETDAVMNRNKTCLHVEGENEKLKDRGLTCRYISRSHGSGFSEAESYWQRLL